MKENIKTLIIIAAIITVIAVSAVVYNSLTAGKDGVNFTASETTAKPDAVSGDNSDRPSETAPDFTVYDAADSAVKLSDYIGTPVIVNFWASWCKYCKLEMPDFEEAYKKYGDKIKFMMVNYTDGVNETKETASSYISKQGFTFSVFFDMGNLSAINAYGVRSFPTTYFIASDGTVAGYAEGMISAETLKKGIDLLIK